MADQRYPGGLVIPERSGAPSLEIGFSDTVTRARLRAADPYSGDLRRLALKFRSSVQRSVGIIDLELDDLLMNLAALSTWPQPSTVKWDPQLAALATDSVRDAQSVASWLAPDAENARAVDPEDVLELLGPSWRGDLTDFQRRDIAKLLSLRHGANFSVPGAGKTRVGLAVFQALRHQEGIERLLIVGPKSAYDAWQYENTECLQPPLSMEVTDGIPSGTEDAIIVNYERLANMVPSLGRWLTERPSMLILDEPHRMKRG